MGKDWTSDIVSERRIIPRCSIRSEDSHRLECATGEVSAPCALPPWGRGRRTWCRGSTNCSDSPPRSGRINWKYIYIYTYIYKERERERERKHIRSTAFNDAYIRRQSRFAFLIRILFLLFWRCSDFNYGFNYVPACRCGWSVRRRRSFLSSTRTLRENRSPTPERSPVPVETEAIFKLRLFWRSDRISFKNVRTDANKRVYNSQLMQVFRSSKLSFTQSRKANVDYSPKGPVIIGLILGL